MKTVKRILTLVMALCLMVPITSFAGEWKEDNKGYWYVNDDGSYIIGQWEWIDGNNDGLAECYYFNENGYLEVNTVIDGYEVNNDGAWIVNSVIQRKDSNITQNNTSSTSNRNSNDKPIDSTYDSKSGLKKYKNGYYYGFMDANNNVVIPYNPNWIFVQRFFEDYAYVKYTENYDDYIYDFINTSGEPVLRFTSTNESLQICRFVANKYGLLGYSSGNNPDVGFIFNTFSLDGIKSYNYEQFKNSWSGMQHTYYHLGTFRNGSANLYKSVSNPRANFVEGMDIGTKVVGSINVFGEYSESINPDSIDDMEAVPEYGTKQFAD
ncbi:hypothetical protein DWX10_27245 [Clostridium sp. AF18-27]|uniref:hypothetical protein n=1 Tax=Enterocloster lavalensis TaxID=460384 RepID=UPI000E4C2F54|nr:hypothetical protein [Enterocloster lavalensis]RHR46054.1 hypothetical protein DWX10_27245 [Clostridium sp. AF18-27]